MSNNQCYIYTMSILEKISSPADLRALPASELTLLADEIRRKILSTVAEHGGHLASNLGTVELTIALLRSMELPRDRIVWDVGHQSYTYKLLTGRQKEFEQLREFNGCCGFPVRNESEFDCYSAGHAGVAISAALGMAAAELEDSPRKLIAVAGDGAIGSGVALEGLNQVREYGRNLIIILNDNKMAISPNVGAISRALNRMMTSYRYAWIKNITKAAIKVLPKSAAIINFIHHLEDAAKNLLLPSEPFQSLGIRYLGPINGHSISDMERTFKAVCRDSRPVLIHIITEKGKGYAPAEAAPERFHGIGKFDIATGEVCSKAKSGFSAAFGQATCKLAQKYPDLTAVTAAMTGGVGLSKFAEKYPGRFYDVGMAEAHAVTFSSGLAAAGKRVICAIYATFMQRSLDNIFHDVCLMDLPVTFVLDRAGLVEDGPTHHGIYELGFLLGLNNLTIMQPGCEDEVESMLEYALELNKPAVIRYPRGCSGAAEYADKIPPEPIRHGKSAIYRRGSDLAIYAVGAEAVRALAIADILQKKYHLSAQVVNVRFLKPFDTAQLQEDLAKMPIFTLEDHVVSTGLGSVAARAAAGVNSPYKLTCFGCPDNENIAFGSVDKLRKSLQLDEQTLAERIAQAVSSNSIK